MTRMSLEHEENNYRNTIAAKQNKTKQRVTVTDRSLEHRNKTQCNNTRVTTIKTILERNCSLNKCENVLQRNVRRTQEETTLHNNTRSKTIRTCTRTQLSLANGKRNAGTHLQFENRKGRIATQRPPETKNKQILQRNTLLNTMESTNVTQAPLENNKNKYCNTTSA